MDDALIEKLRAPLPKDAVKSRSQSGQSLSYVEGWYVIDEANKVFGFDGWDHEVLSQQVVREYERSSQRGKNLVVVASATVRVRALGRIREDVGVGVCDMTLENPAAGIEKALKEAVTDGLKRCFRTFGYRFGLALYDKSQEHVGGSAEAIRMLAELRAVADDALDAWRADNREAIAGLDDEDGAAVRNAYVGRKRGAYDRALARLGDDLKSAETLAAVVQCWRDNEKDVRAAGRTPEDEEALVRRGREACVARLTALEVPAAATSFNKAVAEVVSRAAAATREQRAATEQAAPAAVQPAPLTPVQQALADYAKAHSRDEVEAVKAALTKTGVKGLGITKTSPEFEQLVQAYKDACARIAASFTPPDGDGPRGGGKPAPSNDVTTEVSGGAVASESGAGAQASARSLDALAAYLSTKGTVTEVENALAAHLGDYDADESAQMRVAVARLRAIAHDMSEGLAINRLRLAINNRRTRATRKAAAVAHVMTGARKVA